MTERKTGRVPPLTDWKAWAALAALIITPPSVSTAVLTVKLDGLQAAVVKNTTAADTNTKAVNGIKLELAQRSAMGDALKDHEQRIRKLEGR